MEATTPQHLRTDEIKDRTGQQESDKSPNARDVTDRHQFDRADPRQPDPGQKSDATGGERDKPSLMARLRHHPLAVAAGAVFIVLLVIGGVLWWLNARQYESTDDAFIDTRIVTISAQVAGSISEVNVNDNQLVNAGDVLMRLDARIYQAQLDQTKAQVEEAKASVANLAAQIEAQQARISQANKQVEQAQAALTFAQEEFSRADELAKKGSGTVQQAQQTRSSLLQAEASLSGAQANVVATQKQLAVLVTQLRSAEAQVEAAKSQQSLAEVNLSYGAIIAPVGGRITKLTAAKGTYASPGQALTMLVPQDIWVTANFKETQLTSMRIGQPVDLRIDAFPDRTFHGHVDSFQSGSGTAFSLLPAENATGNYVKVVQRVPVKIVFERPSDIELGPGMSVVPRVKVQ